jgi:hypothetical protein
MEHEEIDVDQILAKSAADAERGYKQLIQAIHEGRQRGIKKLPTKRFLLQWVKTQVKLSGDYARVVEQQREIEELFPG